MGELFNRHCNQSDVEHILNNLTSKFGDHSVVFPERVQVREPLFQQPLNKNIAHINFLYIY